MTLGMKWESSPAFIFMDGVQLSCPRCPVPQVNFQKEEGGLHHYCPTCRTLYETAEQVIVESQAKEAQGG